MSAGFWLILSLFCCVLCIADRSDELGIRNDDQYDNVMTVDTAGDQTKPLLGLQQYDLHATTNFITSTSSDVAYDNASSDTSYITYAQLQPLLPHQQ